MLISPNSKNSADDKKTKSPPWESWCLWCGDKNMGGRDRGSPSYSKCRPWRGILYLTSYFTILPSSRYLAHGCRDKLALGSIAKLGEHLMSVATEALALSRPKKEGVELTSSWITNHSCQVEHLVSDPLHHLGHLCALLPGGNRDQHSCQSIRKLSHEACNV